MDFKNKNALVCGLGKSGVAAANLLYRLGANVTVQDIKDESKFKEETGALAGGGIKLCLGRNPDDILAEQSLVVLSPGIPTDLPFVERAADLGVPVWAEVELAYRLCPCPIMAVTGTNGKTTTTALCYEIMKAHNEGCQVVGNIGIPFTEKVEKLVADDYVVAEISSFQLESVVRFRSRIAAVLNVTPDHLNRHKTMENYTIIKERIFENQLPGDYTILNYDDAACRAMAKKTRAEAVFFSRTETLARGVYLEGDVIRAALAGVNRDLMDVKNLKIFGDHNIENVLAAVAMCLLAGAPPEVIVDTLKTFKGVVHRIEYVAEIGGVSFYNDSKATNTDAAIKSLEAIKAPIVLICGGYEKNADFSQWVKKFSGKVRHVVVLGEVSDRIIETCRAYNFENFDKVNSLKDAVTLGYSKARQGDCVLLSPACASYDMFDSYEQRGSMFKAFVGEIKRLARGG